MFLNNLINTKNCKIYIRQRPMASSTANMVPFPHPFHKRAEEIKPTKSDINNLILDYLTKEGYPNAAAKFSKEANLIPYQEDELIRARHSIINSIHSGDLKTAIDTINELDPEILDRNPSLHFDLLRLQLVELIRNCNSNPGSDITPALTFAAQELAPRAPSNDSFMEDLEKTMTLLVFPSDKLEPDLAELLEPSLRRKVAEKVNMTILARQNSQRESTIRKLIRLRAWAEESARSQNIDLPVQLNVDLSGNTTGEGI